MQIVPNCLHIGASAGGARTLGIAGFPLGVTTEIMGITPEGWTAIEQMEKAR